MPRGRSHIPRVRAYVKNHNLGLEVPYRWGRNARRYLPDFIVLVEDGQATRPATPGGRDQGHRGKTPRKEGHDADLLGAGVNNHGRYGRWAFAEFTEVYDIEAEFKAKIEANSANSFTSPRGGGVQGN